MAELVTKSLIRAALALPLAAVALQAQVGHDPAKSPYRDLKFGQFLSVSAGQALGNGGRLGIGPHDGTVVIARHDFLADRPFSIALGGGWAKLDRNYADTGVVTNRIRGPFTHNLYFAEGIAQLNLTGGKTWHSLAPYVNLGLGLAHAEKLPQDSSGYKFGTRFYVAPGAGVRVFLTRRLFLRLEARAMFWNLSYPQQGYRVADPDGPFGPLLPLLSGQALKEWSPVPVLHAGLAYAFHRPFF